MVLQGGTAKAESNWQVDEAWKPKAVQSILGLPDTTVSITDPKRNTIIYEMSVYLDYDNAESEAKENCLTISKNHKIGNTRGKYYTRRSAQV